MNVSYFLKEHPEFSIVKLSGKFDDCTRAGIEEYCDGFDSRYVRRFYPHTGRGEGQFFALFKKRGELDVSTDFSYSDSSRKPDKNEQKAIEEFLTATLGKCDLNVRIHGENILVLPDGLKVPAKKVFSCGVKLGEYKNGRIIPHHHFFSAFGREFLNKINLSCDSPECMKYLKGEGFEFDAQDGWCAVCVDGIALGGGKMVNGYLKNHYPKGLRIMGN
jgi:NOL1/NOP2/fmu family ribosome biogenesis protein